MTKSYRYKVFNVDTQEYMSKAACGLSSWDGKAAWKMKYAAQGAIDNYKKSHPNAILQIHKFEEVFVEIVA